MIKNRSSFFIRLARHDSLKNNLLSIILAKNPNIDISKRESFFDNLSRFYSIHMLDERTQLEELTGDNTETIDSWINSPPSLVTHQLSCAPITPTRETLRHGL
jgi:hypothetical protein